MIVLDSRLYWLGWQQLLPGIGKRVWKIIDHFGNPEEAWFASESALLTVPEISSTLVDGLVYQRAKINLDQEVERLHKHRVDFITYGDDCYPQCLKEIYDPPPVLFVRGNLNKFDFNSAAIVGSRKATAYGRTAAHRLANELADYNITVVSGMARGVDTAAHRGSLDANGYTIAVLGCGLDVVYPPENSRIFEEIANKGAVISEFPLGSPPEAWHFPSRNRIISGLSKVVIVVEAAMKSGALITADLALSQGREVMVVPGSIYSKMSEGPLKLLKQGARPVTEIGDILDELGVNALIKNLESKIPTKLKLSIIEQKIYDVLMGEPLQLEELIIKIKSNPREVTSALMFLELKGLIKKMPGKMYAAVKYR